MPVAVRRLSRREDPAGAMASSLSRRQIAMPGEVGSESRRSATEPRSPGPGLRHQPGDRRQTVSAVARAVVTVPRSSCLAGRSCIRRLSLVDGITFLHSGGERCRPCPGPDGTGNSDGRTRSTGRAGGAGHAGGRFRGAGGAGGGGGSGGSGQDALMIASNSARSSSSSCHTTSRKTSQVTVSEPPITTANRNRSERPPAATAVRR
jgi:hypothetical protein